MRWLTVAVAGGCLASLIKLTTAAFWVAPAVATRKVPVIAAACAAGALGLAWTLYANAERAATSAGPLLSNSALIDWNLGGDRLNPAVWLSAVAPTIVAAGMLVAPVGALVALRRERLVWAWFAVALAGPLVLFTNLYSVHDYYAAAISPAVAALIGGGADELARRQPRYNMLLVAGAGLSLVVTVSYWTPAYTGGDPNGVAVAAALIAAAPEPVAIRCSDWSPAGFLYAGRRGFISWHGLAIPAGYNLIDDPRACAYGEIRGSQP